jgi:glucose/mannose transport system substrate-binding protein
VLAIAALLGGCGGSEGSVASGDTGTVELYTWLISGGEQQAIDASLNIFRKGHPNVTVTKLTAQDAPTARAVLNLKVQSANLPDTFQANIGADLMRWVYFNGIDESESKLEPIDAYVTKADFYHKLVTQATTNGALYAVPMNIHRINSLFYNKEVFRRFNLDEPTDNMTLASFNQLCARLKAVGQTPLAMGNLRKWPLQELVFEDILPGITGANDYEKYWRGEMTATDIRVVQAIDEALLLHNNGYFNPDADDIDWQAALDLVHSGDAAMGAMGDWAKGYFENNPDWNWKADVDFGVVQFPGESQVFIYTSDTFSLPSKSDPNHRLAIELLQTFASRDSQIQFNLLKGSIPALSGINLVEDDSFDPMQKHTYQLFNSAEQGLAMSGLLPNDVFKDLGEMLSQSLASGTNSAITEYLTRNYAELSRVWIASP